MFLCVVPYVLRGSQLQGVQQCKSGAFEYSEGCQVVP